MKFTFKELDLIYRLAQDEANNAKHSLEWYKESEDADPDKIEATRRVKAAEDLLTKIETAII